MISISSLEFFSDNIKLVKTVGELRELYGQWFSKSLWFLNKIRANNMTIICWIQIKNNKKLILIESWYHSSCVKSLPTQQYNMLNRFCKRLMITQTHCVNMLLRCKTSVFKYWYHIVTMTRWRRFQLFLNIKVLYCTNNCLQCYTNNKRKKINTNSFFLIRWASNPYHIFCNTVHWVIFILLKYIVNVLIKY